MDCDMTPHLLLRPFRLFMIKSIPRMGLNDKSRKRHDASWRERIQDREMSSHSRTERKKRPVPRPSYPELPQEDPEPAVIPGPTRRTGNSRNGPSRYDTPPQRRASRPSPKGDFEDSPEREKESRPARAGTMRKPRFTLFGALLFVLLMPFRFIGSQHSGTHGDSGP